MEDFQDSQTIVKRLAELGYTPKPAAGALPIFADIKEQLEFTYKSLIGENAGALDRIAQIFADDYTTHKMVNDFIIEEAEHKLWLDEKAWYGELSD
jgi:bacterioferritin